MLVQIVGNMLRSIIISFALVAPIFGHTKVWQDIAKETVQEFIEECRLEYNIEKDKIEESLKNQKLPETESGKCFLDCFINKGHMIQGNGKFNHFNVKGVFSIILFDHPEIFQKVKQVIDTCYNEVEVPEEKCGYGVEVAKCVLKTAIEVGLPEYDYSRIMS